MHDHLWLMIFTTRQITPHYNKIQQQAMEQRSNRVFIVSVDHPKRLGNTSICIERSQTLYVIPDHAVDPTSFVVVSLVQDLDK